MRIPSLALLGVTATFVALTPSAASAQTRALPVTGTAFEVTPYAGYLLPGSLFSGPLGSSIGSAPAPLIGTQLGMRVAPNVSVIGNLATGSSDIKAGIPILGGVSVATSRMVLYDAGLQLDMPMATMTGIAFSPFLQAGAGGMRYEVSESLLTFTSNSLAGNVGLGADVTVGSGVGVRLMAKDYIGRYDFQEATGIDYDNGTKNSYALSLGVRFSF